MLLFGASKLVTEYINRGEGHDKVRKVYSVNIVYFSLGDGKDIVYHGKTEFRGIHNGDILELTPFQKQTFKVDAVSQLYPEYYILKVNDFNQIAKSPLEDWTYYLNTGKISATATWIISSSCAITSLPNGKKDVGKDIWKVAWKELKKAKNESNRK